MAAVRDSLCNFGMEKFQIPRPKCVGMEFVTIRGSRSGFYRSINKSVAIKYGLEQRNGAAKRPNIPRDWIRGIEEGIEKLAKDSIPEVADTEPTPDYELELDAANHSEINKDVGKINEIPIVACAPPAPPLPPGIRQSIFKQKNRSNLNKKLLPPSMEYKDKKGNFDLMETEEHKFMGTFWPNSNGSK